MKHDTAEKRQKRQEEFMKIRQPLEEQLKKEQEYTGPKLSLAFGGESFISMSIRKMGLSPMEKRRAKKRRWRKKQWIPQPDWKKAMSLFSLKSTGAFQNIDDDGYVYTVWKVSRNLSGKALPQTERPIQVRDVRKMMDGKKDDELKALFIGKIWTKADVTRIAIEHGRNENPFDEIRSQLILVEKLEGYGWNDECVDSEIFHEMVWGNMCGLINYLERKIAVETRHEEIGVDDFDGAFHRGLCEK